MAKKTKCKHCKYSSFGKYDPSSDFCDDCMTDDDTGWSGFYDHRVGKHFKNEKERKKYYKKKGIW